MNPLLNPPNGTIVKITVFRVVSIPVALGFKVYVLDAIEDIGGILDEIQTT